MYKTVLTDINENFILLSTNVDGNVIYSLGYKSKFGLFKNYFRADSEREAVNYIKQQGEHQISKHESTIKCFGQIKTFLDESESITLGLDKLTEFAHEYNYELYASPLIFEKAVYPGHTVVFKPSTSAPAFVLNEAGQYCEFEFDTAGGHNDTGRPKNMTPLIAEFCTIELSKIYETDKSKSHLQKYRDARFAVDLGL